MFSAMIVDDHPVVREGLAGMLVSEKDFRVVASCADGEEAVETCRKRGVPDIVLLDVRMPRLDGFETLARLKRHDPKVKVLMLAGMPMKSEMERAREMGAAGYVSKSAAHGALLEAVRNIAADAEGFAEEASFRWSGAKGPLTDREIEILRYLADGKRREDVAQILCISMDTVRTHVRHIIDKMGAANTASAIARGYESGILR